MWPSKLTEYKLGTITYLHHAVSSVNDQRLYDSGSLIFLRTTPGSISFTWVPCPRLRPRRDLPKLNILAAVLTVRRDLNSIWSRSLSFYLLTLFMEENSDGENVHLLINLCGLVWSTNGSWNASSAPPNVTRKPPYGVTDGPTRLPTIFSTLAHSVLELTSWDTHLAVSNIPGTALIPVPLK